MQFTKLSPLRTLRRKAPRAACQFLWQCCKHGPGAASGPQNACTRGLEPTLRVCRGPFRVATCFQSAGWNRGEVQEPRKPKPTSGRRLRRTSRTSRPRFRVHAPVPAVRLHCKRPSKCCSHFGVEIVLGPPSCTHSGFLPTGQIPPCFGFWELSKLRNLALGMVVSGYTRLAPLLPNRSLPHCPVVTRTGRG